MVMSVYMTISMTVERYLSIVHPLYTLRNRSGFWNTYKILTILFLPINYYSLHRSKLSVLTLALPGVIFSLIFTSPNYFMLSTTSSSFINDNDTDLENIDIDDHIKKVSQYKYVWYIFKIATTLPKTDNRHFRDSCWLRGLRGLQHQGRQPSGLGRVERRPDLCQRKRYSLSSRGQ